MVLFDLCDAAAAYEGKPVLQAISLRIKAGERVALVGESGSGKSTLLSLLYTQQGQQTALVPQDLGLVKALSVFHNVYMGRLNRHATWYNVANLIRPAKREVAGVARILEKLGLEEKLFTAVGRLSGGQQQRTAIGRALYQAGTVFLGDEPVSAVDEHQARDVLEGINEAYGTVVLAMHDQALAVRFCDRIVGLRNGRIVMDEPTNGMRPRDLDHLYRI